MRAYFLFPVVLFLYSISFAQEMFDNDEAGLHKARLSLKHSFDTFYQENKNPQASEDQSLKTLDAFLSVPVYQTDNFSTSIFAKSQEFHFANIPVNPLTTSTDFYDQQFGFKMSYKEDQDHSWHVSTAYGSASDKTFESGDVSTLSMTLVRKKIVSPMSSWNFFLNYSNNRHFLNNIPLPGLAYSFASNDRRQGWVLGFPFCLYWARPTEKVSTSLFILFPSSLRASVGYMFSPPWQANFKIQYGQDVFIPANRPDKDVRFFYETKKASVGLKTFINKDNVFELDFGRSFNRSMFNGKSSINLTSDRVDLADEWQLTASLQAAY